MFWKTGLKWVFQGKNQRVSRTGSSWSSRGECRSCLFLGCAASLWSLIPLPQLFKNPWEGWLELNPRIGEWARKEGQRSSQSQSPQSLWRSQDLGWGAQPTSLRAESALAGLPVGAWEPQEWNEAGGPMGTPPGLQGCEYLGLGPSFWWIIWNL